MEIDGCRVPGQFDGNAVIGFDAENAIAEPARPSNLHLLGRQRNVVVAGLLDDGCANVLFRTRAIGCLQRFGLDRILKLVIREERRDDLDARK